MASPSTVITMGYGNGNLAGSPSLIVTLGYGAGDAIVENDVGPATLQQVQVRAIGLQAMQVRSIGLQQVQTR